jgi:hypothetical protein
MGRHRKQRGPLGAWVAVLIVGMLMGSVMLTPVGAHIKSFNHLKTKHFYTKKAADNRFINVGEKASDADKLDGKDSTAFLGTTGKAADADKLDGLDSTAFEEVVAYAHVLSGGGVVEAESKGIADANVTLESTSAYCFRNIPAFKFALATPHYDGGADEDVTAAIGLPGTGFTTDCSGTVQAEVATIVDSNYAPHEFYVAFYK